MSKYGPCAKDSTRHDTNYNSNNYNNFSMSKYLLKPTILSWNYNYCIAV